jgi:hypothetical protein
VCCRVHRPVSKSVWRGERGRPRTPAPHLSIPRFRLRRDLSGRPTPARPPCRASGSCRTHALKVSRWCQSCASCGTVAGTGDALQYGHAGLEEPAIQRCAEIRRGSWVAAACLIGIVQLRKHMRPAHRNRTVMSPKDIQGGTGARPTHICSYPPVPFRLTRKGGRALPGVEQLILLAHRVVHVAPGAGTPDRRVGKRCTSGVGTDTYVLVVLGAVAAAVVDVEAELLLQSVPASYEGILAHREQAVSSTAACVTSYTVGSGSSQRTGLLLVALFFRVRVLREDKESAASEACVYRGLHLKS